MFREGLSTPSGTGIELNGYFMRPEEDPESPPVEDPCAGAQAEVTAAAIELGHESPDVRDEASAKIEYWARRCPEIVIPVLENLNRTLSDPEVLSRIRRLLRAFTLPVELIAPFQALVEALRNGGETLKDNHGRTIRLRGGGIAGTVVTIQAVFNNCRMWLDLLKACETLEPYSSEISDLLPDFEWLCSLLRKLAQPGIGGPTAEESEAMVAIGHDVAWLLERMKLDRRAPR